MVTVTVAAFGNRAEPHPTPLESSAVTRGPGNSELPGMLETAPFDDLGRQHHRRVHGEAAKHCSCRTIGASVGSLAQLFDLAIEFFAPR